MTNALMTKELYSRARQTYFLLIRLCARRYDGQVGHSDLGIRYSFGFGYFEIRPSE